MWEPLADKTHYPGGERVFFVSDVVGTFLLPFLYPLMPSQRVFFGYLLVALVMALRVYWRGPARTEGSQAPGFWAWLFPRALYHHPSTKADFQFFYLDTVFQAFVLIPLFVAVAPGLTLWVQAALEDAGVPGLGILHGHTLLWMPIFTLFMALVMDFALFLGHWLQHKIPWLWEFHKTHHSAEVLTPVTVFRVHPVDNLLNYSLVALSTGLVGGLFQHFYAGQGVVLTVFGLNVIFILYYLFGYNLRHSHVWLCYGPFWSRFLVSPAQHQIHHSRESRHLDKNMGFIFAWWDGCFGTLYIPKEKETFSLGIALEKNERFESVGDLFFQPIKNVVQKFKLQWLLQPKRLAHASVFLLMVGLSLGLNTSFTQGANSLPWPDETLYLENLTWTEVQQNLKTGTTTVIIPTGGTEQNGPHMILGKHNYIVRYTAGRIAERLGKTLVAPVLAYVPEGEITPPGDHMRFPGTLSVPEPVFEAVLEATAKSLKAHGFKTICLLGDSGGNQAAQARVARRLSAAWKQDGVRVIHVGNYYSQNGQAAWLNNQGVSALQMGQHAGIRDTSELMAVYSAGVRAKEQKVAYRPRDFWTTGVHGDPRQATAAEGVQLLELKIRAAVRQIRDANRSF